MSRAMAVSMETRYIKIMRSRSLLSTGMIVAASLVSAGDDSGSPKHGLTQRVIAPADAEFFEARIRPILVEQMFLMSRAQEAGIRSAARLAERLLQGNDAGPVVVPGQPEESPLVEAIRHDAIGQDAPQGKAPASGDRRPDRLGQDGRSLAGEPPWASSRCRQRRSTGTAKRHWAFQPVEESHAPAVKDTAWPRTSIDRFILARLEAKGLSTFAAGRQADHDPPRNV